MDTKGFKGDEHPAPFTAPTCGVRYKRGENTFLNVGLHRALARRRLCACDLFLDTPFYNAGSTTVAVLWAGVTLLTLAGDRTVSRLAVGHMLGGGLGGLSVARSLEDYADLLTILGRRKSRGWATARAENHRCRAEPCRMFDADGSSREMERVSVLLRRLGRAVKGGASRFHLVVADAA